MYGYNIPKHKVFISFYHEDDQLYKDYIEKNLSKNIINKSVQNNEYDSDNSDEYIKRLIRDEKISDSSVIVVLVGPNTKTRKHVDWEIYAGLRHSINGSSGLVCIYLPELRKSSTGGHYYDDLPKRVADNIKSGYASTYEWDYAINHFDQIISDAYKSKNLKKAKIDNTAIQMQRNLEKVTV